MQTPKNIQIPYQTFQQLTKERRHKKLIKFLKKILDILNAGWY